MVCIYRIYFFVHQDFASASNTTSMQEAVTEKKGRGLRVTDPLSLQLMGPFFSPSPWASQQSSAEEGGLQAGEVGGGWYQHPLQSFDQGPSPVSFERHCRSGCGAFLAASSWDSLCQVTVAHSARPAQLSWGGVGGALTSPHVSSSAERGC